MYLDETDDETILHNKIDKTIETMMIKRILILRPLICAWYEVNFLLSSFNSERAEPRQRFV